MHELSIATELIRCVLAAAEQHGARRVESIDVEVGPMQQVVVEALEMAFEIVSEGTIAEGASLHVTKTALTATCRECGHAFEPSLDNFLCPQCGQADVDITAGNDIVLTSLSCEVAKT